MSWHFLQGPEAASWEENSLDGAPSALSNLMPMRVVSCLPGSTTECLSPSPSGTTFALSKAIHGEGLLMSSAAASLVPTSVPPESELGLMASIPGCGQKWHGSLAKYDPSSCLWKTHQVSLFAGLTECLETLPKWGLMRDGELWEQPIPDFPMSGSEHGSWPTPKARDWRSGGTDPDKVQARIVRRKKQGVIDLPDAAVHRLWQPGFSGQLIPSFSESLMDWPIGWTACEPLETGKFQEWLQQHGGYFLSQEIPVCQTAA